MSNSRDSQQPNDKADKPKANDFASQAAHGESAGIVSEFVDFLKENKKWWLAPIILSVLGLGALVLLGGTAAAPFIYTLF